MITYCNDEINKLKNERDNYKNEYNNLLDNFKFIHKFSDPQMQQHNIIL